MRVRVEVSGLAAKNISGVGNYSRLLTNSLAEKNEVSASYLNFMNRQPTPSSLAKSVFLEKNIWIPLRLYAKLTSFGISWPFDLFKKEVDLTIHPNFARWPTIKSKLTATVIHDLTYLYYPEYVEEKNLHHLRRVVPDAIEKSDFIITVSESVKQELVKEFNIPEDKCVVTQIPPDENFISSPRNKDVRKKYNIPTNKYILFIGNLEPRKNLITLVKAYRLLPESTRREYTLVVGGGTGWNFEETEKEIEKTLPVGSILRIGFVDQEDLASLYAQASLFVMASHYEGFGMPILESMSVGTRVLAADIPVLRETGGDAADYATADSPEDFSNKIRLILSQPDGSYGSNFTTNIGRFSWSNNIHRITEKCNLLKKK